MWQQFPCSYVALFDRYTPDILIRKKLFNENSHNHAQRCMVVTLQVIVLKSFVLSLHSTLTLAPHYRWLKQNQEQESLKKLKDWIAEEVEYRVQGSEIRNGMEGDGKTTEKTVSWRRNDNLAKVFVSSRWGGEPKYQKCKLCGHSHPIWCCNVFRGRSVERRWETAKRLGLWYRCLGNNHLGNLCPKCREYKINGCKDNHHRLLHAEKGSRQGGTLRGSSNGISPLPQRAGKGIERAIQESRERNSSANQTHLSQESVTSQISEGDANTHTATMKTAQTGEKVVALQMVLLILKNGDVRLLVNCFLEEGSDTNYINKELVVKGRKEPVIVK